MWSCMLHLPVQEEMQLKLYSLIYIYDVDNIIKLKEMVVWAWYIGVIKIIYKKYTFKTLK